MEAKLLTEYGVNDLLGYPLRFPQAPICGVTIHDDDILNLLIAHRHLVVPVFGNLLVQQCQQFPLLGIFRSTGVEISLIQSQIFFFIHILDPADKVISQLKCCLVLSLLE